MPKNTAAGFVIAGISAVIGFALIWHIWWMAAGASVALVVAVIAHTFNYKRDFYIKADVVAQTEAARTKLEQSHV